MSLPTLQTWRDHLDEAGLAQNDALGRKLIKRHAQSWRRYRVGRTAFLESQLARAPLFLTDVFEAPYGAQARVNMREEVDSL